MSGLVVVTCCRRVLIMVRARVHVDGIPARQEPWSDQPTWITPPAHTFEARVRTMEIFLDTAAAHASTDASWLLDRASTACSPRRKRT